MQINDKTAMAMDVTGTMENNQDLKSKHGGSVQTPVPLEIKDRHFQQALCHPFSSYLHSLSDSFTVSFQEVVNVPAKPSPLPKPSKGGFISDGGPIEITMGKSTAGYTNKISYTTDGGKTWKDTNYTNHSTGSIVINDIPRGTEVQFKIETPNKHHFVAGHISSDGIDHGLVNRNPDGSATYKFEDLYGGGDKDFDDAVFNVKNVPPPAPLPKPSKGGFISDGGPIEITMGKAEAYNTNKISYTTDGGKTWKDTGYTNKSTGSFVINDIPKGTEVQFKIETTKGHHFVAGHIGSDGIDHGLVKRNPDGSATYNFENQYGGGDKDFDDAVFNVKNVPPPAPLPKPSKGGFISDGGPIEISMGKSTAGYSNKISYTTDGGKTWKDTNYTNKSTGSFVINDIPKGTEVQFKIETPDGHHFIAGQTGSDGIDHGLVNRNPNGSATYKFEDLYGGGDKDFNDAVFNVKNVPPPAPLPKPSKGGFVSDGGPIQIAMGKSTADYLNKISYTTDGGKTWIEAKCTNRSTGLIEINDIPKGTELQFKIETPDGHHFIAGQTGSDGIDHGLVDRNPNGSATYKFEDLYGGGDKDFDDAVFTVRNLKLAGWSE